MRNLTRSLFPHGFRSMNYISISSYLTWQALDYKLLGFWGSWALQTRQLPDVWRRFKNLGKYGKLLASLVNLFFQKKVWGQFCWNDFSQCIFDGFIYSGEVGWFFCQELDQKPGVRNPSVWGLSGTMGLHGCRWGDGVGKGCLEETGTPTASATSIQSRGINQNILAFLISL